ncbi:hypothetical protein CWD78_21285, partial [Dickeya dadantii]|uniref:hypothetical protein n=1 Tax=Dickeya dadantii TaxID=204038 RepID=UPI001F46EF2D
HQGGTNHKTLKAFFNVACDGPSGEFRHQGETNHKTLKAFFNVACDDPPDEFRNRPFLNSHGRQ